MREYAAIFSTGCDKRVPGGFPHGSRRKQLALKAGRRVCESAASGPIGLPCAGQELPAVAPLTPLDKQTPASGGSGFHAEDQEGTGTARRCTSRGPRRPKMTCVRRSQPGRTAAVRRALPVRGDGEVGELRPRRRPAGDEQDPASPRPGTIGSLTTKSRWRTPPRSSARGRSASRMARASGEESPADRIRPRPAHRSPRQGAPRGARAGRAGDPTR